MMIGNPRLLTICNRCKHYLNQDIKNYISTQASHGRLFQKSYYDILGLKRTASQAEIKAAYFELSKVHHPDKADITCHEKFVEIGKAYEILGKPVSRRDYDRTIYTPSGGNRANVRYKATATNPFGAEEEFDWYKAHVYDEDLYKAPRDPDAYYGIKGFRRIPNAKLILGLLLFAGIGGFLQIVFIFAISDYRQTKLDERDKKISMVLEELDRKMKLKKLARQGMTSNLVNQTEANDQPSATEGVEELDGTAKTFKYNKYYSYPVQGRT